jgi:chlorite dismutase
MPDRQFVKYTFLKVDPAWRRLDAEERAQHKREFAAACADFAETHFLRAYSLVGTRGDTDLMLRMVCQTIDPIHEFHVVQPLAPREGSERKYLIVYPMWKKREWYGLPGDERMRIMRGHIETGRRYGTIEINTAYSFGLDDQEFVVSFNTDDPSDFLDLVHELRSTESSAYTESETPIFTCMSASPERALDALDGEAVSATALS